MSKRELTEVEQLRHENHRLRNEAESYKVSRDNAFTLIEHLEQRVNDKARIKALEQLCRDLFGCANEPKCCNCEVFQGEEFDCMAEFEYRMTALGLLGGNND